MMKRIALSILLIFTTLLVDAKVYKPADISPVHLFDANRYVCNPDGILSQVAVDRIDAAFRTIEDSTGVQTLVAVLELIIIRVEKESWHILISIPGLLSRQIV